jgi:hypothetical protein
MPRKSYFYINIFFTGHQFSTQPFRISVSSFLHAKFPKISIVENTVGIILAIHHLFTFQEGETVLQEMIVRHASLHRGGHEVEDAGHAALSQAH